MSWPFSSKFNSLITSSNSSRIFPLILSEIANLSNETKREICPPHGSPFRNINVNINNIALYSTPVINKYAINLIEQFINKGIDDASRSLGCYYVLASLTLVNQSAAEALPWLYQSVQYN